MSESYEHNPGDHEDPLIGPTWTIGIAGAALLVASILAVAALNYRMMSTFYDRNSAELNGLGVATLNESQLVRLEGTRLERRPDSPEGQASLVIPIDRAIDLVVEEAAASRRR